MDEMDGNTPGISWPRSPLCGLALWGQNRIGTTPVVRAWFATDESGGFEPVYQTGQAAPAEHHCPCQFIQAEPVILCLPESH